MLKFHGKFRELVPNGFTFQKLYARNYRCYHKEIKYGDHIWIWQHHGGYVELNDLYDDSALVIAAIVRGENGPWALDRETHQLHPFASEKHEAISMQLRGLMPSIDTTEGLEAYRTHCRKWRRVDFEDETKAAIKDMAQRGWISIVP